MNNTTKQTPWALNKTSDPLHSLCSYLGAFPPSLSSYFIQNFSNEGDLIYDPFSGRGTTLLESRILSRNCLASDLNPIALSLSRAKSKNLMLSTVIARINELEEDFDYALFLPEAKAQIEDIHLIFHPKTLAELCYLRLVLLDSNSDVDHFIIGAILGVMHGGERKDGTSGYLSISMPNTFSMSAEYVRRYVQTQQLNREYRNVFETLRVKTERSFKNHCLPKIEAKVLECDAKRASQHPELKKSLGMVDLILTSPPYLGIVNYAKQNWIRSWFLKADPIEISNKLDDDLNLFEWVDFAKKTIEEMKKFLKPNGVAILVIGDVAKSKNSIIPLAREFTSMVKENKIFKNIWVFSDYIHGADKTTRIWGETKGKATATDRIVILSDVNPFEKKGMKTKGHFLTEEILVESTKEFMGENSLEKVNI